MQLMTTKIDLVEGRAQLGLDNKFTKLHAAVEPPLAALRGLLPRGFNLVNMNPISESSNYKTQTIAIKAKTFVKI